MQFLLGLAIGLAIMAWYRRRLRFQMVEALGKVDLRASLGSFRTLSQLPIAAVSQLATTVGHQQEHCQQLEQQVESWKQILYHAPVAYLQLDDENRLIWCNAVAHKLLAIPQWELVTPRLLLQLVRSYELDQLIDETRAHQRPVCTDWVFHLPLSPESKPSAQSQREGISIRGYGLPLENGQVGVFLENRQEAEVLKQQRDRWASDVAHELKTPLTSIRLVAETLQARLDPPLRAWVDRLINEVIRLSNLVQDLLDLSQLQMNASARLTLKPVNLAELVHSAWLSLELLARKKHIALDYVGANPAIVYADEPRLYRVLINLLDNSIKYSPPRQSIQVNVKFFDAQATSCSSSSSPPLETDKHQERASITLATSDEHCPKNQYVCIDVIDAGPGFQEQDLPYVFDRFYQADLSRTRSRSSERNSSSTFASDSSAEHSLGSSGLGLAIVRQIVEAHYGTVKASNHPETGGAWLQIILPCHPPTVSELINQSDRR